MTFAIREVTEGDLPALFAYLGDQLTENGRNGNPLFQPMAPVSDPVVPAPMKARFTNGLSTPVGEPGWRRAWIAVGAEGAIAGHIDLRALPDAESSHRALLGMGVHRDHRRAGLGMRLIAAATAWARAQAGFDWIDLEVLSANHPAIALYHRAGFHKTGEVPDMFRIEGERHAYTFMSLPLL